MAILVTGGAGFIGSHFVLDWCKLNNELVINLDLLTYAGSVEHLRTLESSRNHVFVHGNIADSVLVTQLLQQYQIRAVIHFAAESHVDRSIANPAPFVHTNILGTFQLLEACRVYWNALPETRRSAFRFLQISTDEVYGSYDATQPLGPDTMSYHTNNPYSASKAAGDHLIHAYNKTYGFPTLLSHSSNNYGPMQHPEKLIPLCIERALAGKSLPLYGDGLHQRDWLYAGDHVHALQLMLAHGHIGESYNISGNNEYTNLAVVKNICDILDTHAPRQDGKSYHTQITFVQDRPGHDRRYVMDTSKIKQSLGWEPQQSFETGLLHTVQWSLELHTQHRHIPHHEIVMARKPKADVAISFQDHQTCPEKGLSPVRGSP